MDITELLGYAGKPEIFTRTDTEFWDDPHISREMLEAHLNPELAAASRSHNTIDASVNWLTEKILPERDIKILDLGCGPGLYTYRLARLGYSLTGIDYSRNSLNYARRFARKENLEIEYKNQNYLTIDYKEEFDVILLIYCDLGALTDKEREILLGRIHQSLKPGGLFIFDVFTDKNRDENSTGRSWEIEKNGFWSPSPYLALTETFLYPDRDTFLDQTIVMTDEGKIDVYRIYDHFYTKATITELLDSQSFKNHAYYSDLTGSDYNQSSETIALITHK